MDISVLERDEQWADLEAAWDELVAASTEDNPFRRWLWNWTWWKHYGQGRRLAILVARENGVLIGLAPFFLQDRASRPIGRTLRLLGSTDVCSEYLGLIVRRSTETRVVPALLAFLFDQWRQTWDMLHWTDLPSDGAEVPLIEAFLQDRGLPFARRPDSRNLRVHLPANGGIGPVGSPLGPAMHCSFICSASRWSKGCVAGTICEATIPTSAIGPPTSVIR